MDFVAIPRFGMSTSRPGNGTQHARQGCTAQVDHAGPVDRPLQTRHVEPPPLEYRRTSGTYREPGHLKTAGDAPHFLPPADPLDLEMTLRFDYHTMPECAAVIRHLCALRSQHL